MPYYILRKYFKNGPWSENRCGGDLVAEGLTLEEAQEHCSSPESGSDTCSTREGVDRTERCGPWMDCFYKDDDEPDS